MAVFNIPDFKENSLILFFSEKLARKRGTQCKTYKEVSKNLTLGLQPTNKQTADEVFHDISNNIILNSQLQNEVTNLEQQSFRSKKSCITKATSNFYRSHQKLSTEENATNQEETKMKVKNLNFNIFYKYKGEKSHLISFIYKYQLVVIQDICNIKKNKFKPKNIMKLSTSIR